MLVAGRHGRHALVGHGSGPRRRRTTSTVAWRRSCASSSTGPTVLLQANRWLVLAIANAMLSKRTITGEDVDAIYQGREGPTVDGEWYHRPIDAAVARGLPRRRAWGPRGARGHLRPPPTGDAGSHRDGAAATALAAALGEPVGATAPAQAWLQAVIGHRGTSERMTEP